MFYTTSFFHPFLGNVWMCHTVFKYQTLLSAPVLPSSAIYLVTGETGTRIRRFRYLADAGSPIVFIYRTTPDPDVGEEMGEEYLKQLILMQKQVLDSVYSVLSAYGVSITFEKVVLYPEDDPDAIDLVYRVKCTSSYLCSKLKEELEKTVSGEGEGGNVGGGEEG